MKIALINNLYAPVSRGGAERIVELQASALRSAGHQVVVVTTRPWGKRLPKNEDGIYRIGGWSGSFFHLHRLPPILRFFWHMWQVVDFITPWWISVRLAYSGCEAAIGHNILGLGLRLPKSLSRFKIRYVQVLHDIQYMHPSGLLYKHRENQIESLAARTYQWCLRQIFKSAMHVISPSKWLGGLYAKHGVFRADKITYLPNPVELSAAIRHDAQRQSSGFIWLFVGQLEPHKGVVELTEAFSQLKGDTQLWLVGEGSQRSALEKLSLSDRRIVLHGRQDRDKVAEMMAMADALAVPSVCYENFPTVVLEAFASKLPVLGSDWGGTGELLAGGFGFTADVTDHALLVKAMTEVMATPDERLREIADRALIKAQQYEMDTYNNNLLQLIR